MMNALGSEGICPICNHDTFVVGRLSASGLTFTPQGEWPTAVYPNWVQGRACQRCGYLQLFVELKPSYRETSLPGASENESLAEENPSLKSKLKRMSDEWFSPDAP